MMLLTACSTGPDGTVAKTCPAFYDYTTAQKNQVKLEIGHIPDYEHSELGEWLKDFSVQNQQSRDCWTS
jgi:hypothetical protein